MARRLPTSIEPIFCSDPLFIRLAIDAVVVGAPEGRRVLDQSQPLVAGGCRRGGHAFLFIGPLLASLGVWSHNLRAAESTRDLSIALVSDHTIELRIGPAGTLVQRGVGAVVIGAVALAAHGYARFTEDIDLGVNTDLGTLRQEPDKRGFIRETSGLCPTATRFRPI